MTKVPPIISTLRGGYLKTLITDEVTARGVLEQWEQDPCQTATTATKPHRWG
jgi:hypothetical protein